MSKKTSAHKSGWMLVLGLAFVIPFFSWWGTTIKIKPVAEVERGENGRWVLPTNVRWSLPLKDAESFRVDQGTWTLISESSLPRNGHEKIWLRWPEKSLWSLIRLELIP